MSDRPRLVQGYGVIAHYLDAKRSDRQGHAVGLCGRRVKAAPPDGETALCRGCETKYVKDERSREWIAARMASAARKTDINREGRFVVYRCRLCGAQHFPAERGQPFCFDAAHVAELEVLEVQGPAFVAPEVAA